MEVSILTWWCGLLLGAIPLLLQAFWYFNDLLFLASLRLRKSSSSSSKESPAVAEKLPPGYMGLPFFCDTLTFLWYFMILRRPDDFIHSKKKRYGKGVGLYRTHLFGSPTVITCSPAANKFVLQSEGVFRVRWPAAELVGVTSIANVEGKQHERLRSFIIHAVNHPNALRQIASKVQPRMVSTLRSWFDKGTIRALIETKKVTFENICKMFASMEPGPLLDEIFKLFEGLLAGLRAYPIDLPGTTYHHAVQCRRKLTALFREELEKRKARKNETEEDGTDLMDGLMRIKDEEGKKLSNDEVVDNIVSFVVAGYESTSLATMWAMYHLSKSPAVLQNLREEHREISKEKKGEFVDMDDMSKMKYTTKVVEETIRTANIAPLIFRASNRDVEYRGFRIPKGWQVVVWIRSLHVDPENFEDPLCFNPDRWNEPAKPGTYQVFGGGPRICAGNMLVRIQLHVILHHLAMGYKWNLLNPSAKDDIPSSSKTSGWGFHDI